MTIKAHLIRTKDIIASWDGSMFADIEEANIDETNHTIQNVCVFGTRYSKNGYTYQDPAIEALTHLSNGSKFFINHPSKSEAKDRDGVRDIRDWAGIFSNSHRDGEKVFSNLTVRPVFWELVKDVATMRPEGVGNSINSRVKVYKDDKGQEHVVEIESLKSIDLVASAATTTTLFESTHEDVENERQSWVEEITEMVEDEPDGTTKAIVFHNITNYMEGLLVDKIKEKKISRAISDLNWQASDVIEEILRDKKMKIADKKKSISAVLDDLESEIGKIMSGKGTAGKGSTMPELLHNKQDKKEEEDEMDWTKLTMEELGKERPDLVDAIKATIQDAEKVKGMEEENGTLKKANEDLTKVNEDLTKKVEGFETEIADLKKKVDEFETKANASKKDAFITEKLGLAKLPKEAVSDLFKADLMGKQDEDIEKAIKDRAELWSTSKDKINAGDEFRDTTESNFDDLKKKKESAQDKFKGAIK